MVWYIIFEVRIVGSMILGCVVYFDRYFLVIEFVEVFKVVENRCDVFYVWRLYEEFEFVK